MTDNRKSYLGTRDIANLNLACMPIKEAFGHPPYLVGSSTARADYRDVDVRLILPDEEFDAVFEHREFLWSILCWSISEWLAARTGLPIDFQIQRMTEANEKYPSFATHPRNPMGMRGREFAGGGDAKPIMGNAELPE